MVTITSGQAAAAFDTVNPATGEVIASLAITRQRMRPPVNLTSFSRTDKDLDKVLGLVTLLHGRRSR